MDGDVPMSIYELPRAWESISNLIIRLLPDTIDKRVHSMTDDKPSLMRLCRILCTKTDTSSAVFSQEMSSCFRDNAHQRAESPPLQISQKGCFYVHRQNSVLFQYRFSWPLFCCQWHSLAPPPFRVGRMAFVSEVLSRSRSWFRAPRECQVWSHLGDFSIPVTGRTSTTEWRNNISFYRA